MNFNEYFELWFIKKMHCLFTNNFGVRNKFLTFILKECTKYFGLSGADYNN